MTNIEMLEKTLPAAPLKLIAMESCQALGQKVNDYIVSFRDPIFRRNITPSSGRAGITVRQAN